MTVFTGQKYDADSLALNAIECFSMHIDVIRCRLDVDLMHANGMQCQLMHLDVA
jgi:hypothetical protein